MTVTRETPVALWDSLDVVEYGPVRDMRVYPATTGEVTEFCRRWHYSKTGGAQQWMFGLYQGVVLVGVASFAPPPIQAAECVLGRERASSVLGMSRLVCAEEAPRNSESRLISGALAGLSRIRPETRAVVTYAAPDVGHLGYIYQATNALYTGPSTVKDYFIDEAGVRWPVYRDGKTLRARPGWTRHKGAPKHRYVYLLGNKSERKESRALLRLPVLPYPKAATP